MKQQPSDLTDFPKARLARMLGFHACCFVLEILTYLLLVPSMQKTFMEFGIELPGATKFVLSWHGLRLLALLVTLGMLHSIAAALYAWLACSSQLNWARTLALVTTVIWLIWLIFHVAALGLPFLAIIDSLTRN